MAMDIFFLVMMEMKLKQEIIIFTEQIKLSLRKEKKFYNSRILPAEYIQTGYIQEEETRKEVLMC
jgi:hypothetical protein